MLPERRRQLLAAAAVMVLVVAAFSVGRFTAPRQVEERAVERIVYKDRIVEKRVEVAAEAKVVTRIVYRDRTIAKDGTVTEHEVERTDAASAKKTEATVDRVETHDGTREVIVEKRVTVQPDWRVGVLAGASLREPLVPIAGPLVLGVEVDRRIAGGLSLGIWASTVGAAGISASLEF